MFELITKETINEYEAFISHHPKGHFLQSSKWAAVKPSWKWEAIVVRNASGDINGALAVLIRNIPILKNTLMYAARGPVCDPHDSDTLAELTRGAAALAKKHKAYSLKLDPDILATDTEFCRIMTSLGYRHHVAGKNFEGVQPNFVFRLDIKDKTEEQLMESFHQKTRYNIRLSVRKGVTVKLCGKEMVEGFSRIMNETGARDGFIVRNAQYFSTMLDALGDNARLYMAFVDDKPIAGTLAILFGNKVWYLYGASSNQYRNVMPNYQLQMEMIRWALENKCDIYDFRGVSGDLTPENPLYGLYLFKKGFNGDLCEFCGEFEMIYNKTVYFAATKGVSTLRKIRHSMIAGKKQSKKVENTDI